MEEKKNYLIDMDGVLVHGKKLIPGADTFIESLKKNDIKFWCSPITQFIRR